MLRDLAEYRRKRGRALQHLDVLRESIKRSVYENVEAVRGEFDSDASKYAFRVPLPPVHPDWALLVGDFAYNARAALDYLVTALIRSTGNEEHDASQFPIYGVTRRNPSWLHVEERWEADPDRTIERSLTGTPPNTKAVLKQLQPFYGVPTTDPARHPLLQLQALSNRDKHRRLNLLVRNARVSFTDAEGHPVFEGPEPLVRISEPDEADAYTVTLRIGGQSDVDMYLVAAHDISFREPPYLLGNVVETLALIHEFIGREVLLKVASLMR